MKTLILFASKSGASQECAELLLKKIPDSCICNLLEESVDIRDFDTIIIGSGVRMGKIYKPVLKLLQKNTELLCTKKLALYLCNAYSDTFEKIVVKNIPKEIIQCAIIITSFGGKKPFSNSQSEDWQNASNINNFLQIVCE